MTPRDVVYFGSPEEFRRWLAKNGAKADVLWVGYYKRATGRPSLTWAQSVDAALCYGWIDGIRKSVDEERYTIRFTPRRPGSTWSAVNTRRVPELKALGLMKPAGLKAFAARQEYRSGIYSYENRPAELPEALAKIFRKEKAAWAFFQAQTPSYRKLATWFILSGKKDETRLKRLARLIETSARGRKLV